jgi:ATP-dependent Clp protease, protease subunit
MTPLGVYTLGNHGVERTRMEKILAPAFMAVAILAWTNTLARGDETVTEDSDVKITVVQKENKNKKKPFEASLKELLDNKKIEPADAYKTFEFYQGRVVHLNDRIGEDSADEVIYKMRILDELDPGKPIILKINSPGGSVYDGLRIYNTMMTLQSPTHTVCTGMAASMAAVLTVAGKERLAMPSCRIMIHEAAAGASGKTSDMAYALYHVKGLEDYIFEIIARHSQLHIEDVKLIGSFEVFYNAGQAVRLGFVDRIAEARHGPDETAESKRAPKDLLPESLLGPMWAARSRQPQAYNNTR